MTIGLISFSCAAPVASWSPSVNPRREGGYLQGTEIFQPTGFCGADLYSYDHGSVNTRTLEWSFLPAADMETLLTFLGLVKGQYTFAFTDYEATVYSACRVRNFEDFEYRHVTLDYFETSLEIEVAS